MAEISTDEINRWLNSTSSEPADIACRAYIAERHKHIGGECPDWCRVNWHDLKIEYREFLVSMVTAGIDTAVYCDN